MKYKLKYRRGFFWKKATVVGHGYNKDMDRLTLYFENGGLSEIPEWSKCECYLGADWALAAKKKMEEKAGQSIVVNRNLNAK
jgi:hypothetical protein